MEEDLASMGDSEKDEFTRPQGLVRVLRNPQVFEVQTKTKSISDSASGMFISTWFSKNHVDFTITKGHPVDMTPCVQQAPGRVLIDLVPARNSEIGLVFQKPRRNQNKDSAFVFRLGLSTCIIKVLYFILMVVWPPYEILIPLTISYKLQ